LFKPALKALLTWVPGVQAVFYDGTAGGGTASAEYCYGVWLKHLTLLWHHGMRTLPRSVIELGPGDSLGTGFAALLSGAESYVALDSVPHANPDRNVRVFREIAALLRARAPRPRKGWPDFDGLLDERLFPGAILGESHLRSTLAEERIRRLEAAAAAAGTAAAGPIRYSGWTDDALRDVGAADLIFSHVVLNVIEELDVALEQCARWLKPGGWMSHQIDLRSLRVTPQWNGHLCYGERTWRFLRGRRPFFVSRERCSGYVEKLRRHGLEPVGVLRHLRSDGVPRERLAAPFRGLADEDLQCWEAFIVARKRAG